MTESTLVPATAASVSDIIRFAIDKGTPVEQLERLVALQERILDRNAESEFHDAMAEFQRTCPEIKKSSTASFKTDVGASVSYTFARLDEIARTIRGPLAAVGLSYSWASEVKDGMMVVTCTVRHRSGHARSASFTSEIKGTKLMSGSQAAGAAVTFAERYSLIQALGLTTTDDDVDGVDDAPGSAERITANQAANLESLLTEVKGDRPRFLEWVGAGSIDTIRACDFKRAMGALEAKRRKA